MPPDPQVIATLVTAVDADPESSALRLHLASLLLDDGRAAEALPHLELVLSDEPMNVEALLQATRATESLGDPRASQYRRLATSLSIGSEPEVAQARSGAAPAGEGEQAATPAAQAHGRGAGGPGSIPWRIDDPKITLADVSGFAHVKRRLSVSFLAPLLNPAIREALGQAARGGVLLFGPPNCGKTFIARALAGELGGRFLFVDLAAMAETGNPEEMVGAILALARRDVPTVVFFDGLDVVGRRRRNLIQGPGDQLVEHLMAEIETAERADDGVFTVGATDHPWDIDPAMLRPGRFDRFTLVLPPDRPARIVILQQQLADRPMENVDLGAVADRLDGYSGGDIVRLCEAASWLASSRGLTPGAAGPITEKLMNMALELVEPSSRAWFETARNFALFANHDGMYDDLVTYMRSRHMI